MPLLAVVIGLASLPMQPGRGSPAPYSAILTALSCYLVPLGAQWQGGHAETTPIRLELAKDRHGSGPGPLAWSRRPLEAQRLGTRLKPELGVDADCPAAPALAERAPPGFPRLV